MAKKKWYANVSLTRQVARQLLIFQFVRKAAKFKGLKKTNDLDF